MSYPKKRNNCFHRFVSCVMTVVFFSSTVIYPAASYSQSVAQQGFSLPPLGTMLSLTEGFKPPMVKGLTLHPENPLMFDFIVDTGDERIQGQTLSAESNKLIKYFLASLTIPEDQMWVNLSPYEKDRIIGDNFGSTEMGRDLLGQDYILKQFTASLIYPEHDLGRKFWDQVYQKVKEKYGTSEIPTNTFNKVWIIPDVAQVYEKDNSVFVIDSHLKVMLEEDYLALKQNGVNAGQSLDVGGQDDSPNKLASEMVREIILPEIEKEVNQGKTFANLRQIYHSMILATWYKKKLKESILGQVYVNKNKTRGVEVEDKEIKQKIYEQYVAAFKQGVYNYIKEEYDPATQESIPKKYFSGGFGFSRMLTVLTVSTAGLIGSPTAADAKFADFVQQLGPTALVTWRGLEISPKTPSAILTQIAGQNEGGQFAIVAAQAAQPYYSISGAIEKDDPSGINELTQLAGEANTFKLVIASSSPIADYLRNASIRWNLWRLGDSSDEEYQSKVSGNLRKHGVSALPALLEILEKESPSTSTRFDSIVSLLGEIRDRRSLLGLLNKLDELTIDSENSSRDYFAIEKIKKILKKFLTSEFIDLFITQLNNSKNNEVIKYLVESLVKFNGDARVREAVILKLQENSSIVVTIDIVDFLGKTGDSRAANILFRALRPGYSPVHIIAALKLLHDPSAEFLEGVYEELDGKNSLFWDALQIAKEGYAVNLVPRAEQGHFVHHDAVEGYYVESFDPELANSQYGSGGQAPYSSSYSPYVPPVDAWDEWIIDRPSGFDVVQGEKIGPPVVLPFEISSSARASSSIFESSFTAVDFSQFSLTGAVGKLDLSIFQGGLQNLNEILGSGGWAYLNSNSNILVGAMGGLAVLGIAWFTVKRYSVKYNISQLLNGVYSNDSRTAEKNLVRIGARAVPYLIQEYKKRETEVVSQRFLNILEEIAPSKALSFRLESFGLGISDKETTNVIKLLSQIDPKDAKEVLPIIKAQLKIVKNIPLMNAFIAALERFGERDAVVAILKEKWKTEVGTSELSDEIFYILTQLAPSDLTQDQVSDFYMKLFDSLPYRYWGNLGTMVDNYVRIGGKKANIVKQVYEKIAQKVPAEIIPEVFSEALKITFDGEDFSVEYSPGSPEGGEYIHYAGFDYRMTEWVVTPEVPSSLEIKRVIRQVGSDKTIEQNPQDGAASSPVGGIDLNSAALDLQIKRDGNGVPLPLLQQPIQNMNIEGFYPVILNIVPVQIPLFFGLSASDAPQKLSSLK